MNYRVNSFTEYFSTNFDRLTPALPNWASEQFRSIGTAIIAQETFTELIKSYPPLGEVNTKLQEVIRDQLTPSDQVQGIWAVQISGVAGLVCLTQNDIYTFWTQKMFFFFKFPAVQTFHLAHLRSVQQTGTSVALRAQADPSGSPDDYEENTLQFGSSAQAQDFAQRLKEN